MKKVINILIITLIMILILYLNISSLLFIMLKFRDYSLCAKYIPYFGVVLFVLYLILKFIKKEKIKIYDIIILVLSIFGFISYLCAYDKNTALFGYIDRNEGLLVILTYYILFLVSTIIDSKYKNILIKFILLTGILEVILGTIQFFNIRYIFGYDRVANLSNSFNHAVGSLGNPNFYSTYILINLVYVYGNLLNSKNIKQFFLNLFLTLFFVYGLLIGNTLSCILAFIIILIIGSLKKSKYKKYLFIFFIILLLFISVGIFTNRKLKKIIINNTNEIIYILKNGIDETTGNSRVYIWKKTINNVYKYLYTGIGIDNFTYIDDGKMLCTYNHNSYQCFDKVHNEYLQKLITEGIFSFMLYMSLLFYIIFKYFKSYKSDNKYCLFLCFIGYLIQAFFNISVIQVSPIFYMIMGFIINEDVVIE